MNFNSIFAFVSAVALVGFTLVGCVGGKDDKERGVLANAKAEFSKVAGQSVGELFSKVSALANSCPGGNTCAEVSELQTFEIKLLRVGISTHADTTQGYGSSIFVNSACPRVDLETEIDGKTYSYVGAGSCSDSAVSSYLDLRKSASEVNTDLNSQYLPIAPGTYPYGHLEFCQGGAASNNYRVTFTSANTLPAALRGQSAAFQISTCGTTTPQMNPPMTVGEGQSVVVTLEYDLSNTVYYRQLGTGESASSGCAEIGTGGDRYSVCLQPPTMTGSFSTN